MYKDMNTQNLPRQKQQHQSIPLRYQYTKEQLLALQTSPLVSKPASLPPLSSWLNRDSSLSNCSGQHNQTAMGAHDRYIQPKASISTPSRSSNYSKMMETTGQYWNHRQNQPKEGRRYHSSHTTTSNNTINNLIDDHSIPEWMDDNPSDLTKDEQTEKMVLDSFQMEEWKLRMKQLDDDRANNGDMTQGGDDKNRTFLLAENGNNNNNENHQSDKDEKMSSLLALESIHLTTFDSPALNTLDDIGSYTTKSVSVHELFQQHQHLPSPPSSSTPFLLSPRDDQIGGFGPILSNQSIMPQQDHGNFMNGGYRNVIQQQEQHQLYQRPPPGFMLPSPEHQSRMKLYPNDPMLSTLSPGAFSVTNNGGDNPRPPPMMTSSFSTGTTGSHHPYSMLQHQHHHQSLSSQNNNNSNNIANQSIAPSFTMSSQHIPSHYYQQHPSMMFNRAQSMLQQQQQYHRLLPQQQQYLQHLIPPSSLQNHQEQIQQLQQQQYIQQTYTFPSQLLHHPYHPQPLVTDLNK